MIMRRDRLVGLAEVESARIDKKLATHYERVRRELVQ